MSARGSVLAACLILLGSVTATAAQQAPRVAVFVSARHAAGSAPTEAERGLDDAARELREALAKKKTLLIVEVPAEAQVRVEVTDREQRDAGEGGFGGVKLTPLAQTIIRFHATAPDGADIDLKGVGAGYWSRAAKDGADKLANWIGRHTAQITPKSQLPTSKGRTPKGNAQGALARADG